jgi:hypothetical protein
MSKYEFSENEVQLSLNSNREYSTPTRYPLTRGARPVVARVEGGGGRVRFMLSQGEVRSDEAGEFDPIKRLCSILTTS